MAVTCNATVDPSYLVVIVVSPSSNTGLIHCSGLKKPSWLTISSRPCKIDWIRGCSGVPSTVPWESLHSDLAFGSRRRTSTTSTNEESSVRDLLCCGYRAVWNSHRCRVWSFQSCHNSRVNMRRVHQLNFCWSILQIDSEKLNTWKWRRSHHGTNILDVCVICSEVPNGPTICSIFVPTWPWSPSWWPMKRLGMVSTMRLPLFSFLRDTYE